MRCRSGTRSSLSSCSHWRWSLNACEPLILDGLSGAATLQLRLIGIGGLAVLALMRESMDGFANWLTWRTRIGLQYAMLEATIGKLHRMPLAAQRSEGIGAIMTRLDRSIQGLSRAGPCFYSARCNPSCF